MKRVLVVEDDEATSSMLLSIFERAGYLAEGAAHGVEALEVMRRGPLPDVVVMDLMMPVMDGWDFRRKQQCDPGLARVPVVIVSAVGDVDLHANALSVAGALDKPVALDELLAVVRRALGE